MIFSVSAFLYVPDDYLKRVGDTIFDYFPHIPDSALRRGRICISPLLRAQTCYGEKCPYDSTVRAKFIDKDTSIYSWPSRGGVIVLDDAEAIDFEFLGLNPLDPPVERLDSQAAEDAFCQRLLLLGAKWWDSEARYLAVARMGGYGGRADDVFHMDVEPQPTMCEKSFVKVGWSSTGGLWVAELDTTFAGVDEEDNLSAEHEEDKMLPEHEGAGRLRMARTMDERCIILRDRFKATFYEYVKDYKGHAFLNSWETKETGETGPLLQPDETLDLWYNAI